MKRIISFILSLCILVTSTVIVGAAEDEVYLSDLKIIYADSYEKACEKLADSDYADYEILDANLNSKTGETGVWLCYKTTTDIEDAITDISAMYMDGGYHEGNYRAMVENSQKEYLEMSETYLKAVEYFTMAYDEGDFFAESAYRQLNLYCDNEDHNGERIGDLFISGIDAPVLATMFMEGNIYALRNIRSLLAQGCSYNESSLTYMETVGEMAALYNEDPECFEDFENYEEFKALAILISATVKTFGEMFRELESVEDELNYEDDETTELEIKYLEYQAIADMTRAVEYTEDKTLYDFCLSYTVDLEDPSPLYPLVAALNEGQIALTKVNHYYDVVRYSVSELPEELMDSEISELEEEYEDDPFDIYLGVDRSIYKDTYALTTEAYRADAYSESGFTELLDSTANKLIFGFMSAIAAGGLCIFAYAVFRAVKASSASKAAAKAAEVSAAAKVNADAIYSDLLNSTIADYSRPNFECNTYGELIDGLCNIYLPNSEWTSMTFAQKVDAMNKYYISLKGTKDHVAGVASDADKAAFFSLKVKQQDIYFNSGVASGQPQAEQASEAIKPVASSAGSGLTAFLFFLGGTMMIASAITSYMTYHNYYHPEYSDVPVSLVDMKSTVDGDRYIKYDAVYEATDSGDGNYYPADTNAYKAQRWVTLYYTKSYEAGKPLLSDFTLSKDNQYAEDGSLPVHLFGENICYNLNKYNFDSDSDRIYLSVKQSEYEKSAVGDIPELVGSMTSGGYLFMAAAMGAILGIGVCGAFISKKNKKA